MAMALNLGLLVIPQEERTIERGMALLMVNNRVTYQRQSWLPEAPTGKQALFIPTASNNNCLVPAIVEEQNSILTHAYFPLCLCGTQKTVSPDGMYIEQIDQTHIMLIEACTIH